MTQREKPARLVVGNWKMHGGLAENAALLQDILAGLQAKQGARPACLVAVCSPYPYLGQLQQVLSESTVAWGAQNVNEHERGAFTGEVSVDMLADFGCRYVIVGHSERRALFGETSELVAAKAERALEGGLIPIVCVGETLAERESGRTESVVGEQLRAVLDRLGPKITNTVLAYEPVWAIGTGKTASPEQAQEVHAFLRGLVAQRYIDQAAGLQLLYGGSVKPGNAAELFAKPDINGGLIGGAALVAKDFLDIVAAG